MDAVRFPHERPAIRFDHGQGTQVSSVRKGAQYHPSFALPQCSVLPLR